MLDSLFAQPLSKFSLIYLLVWHPQYSIHFFTQSLASFCNTCPYQCNLFCFSVLFPQIFNFFLLLDSLTPVTSGDAPAIRFWISSHFWYPAPAGSCRIVNWITYLFTTVSWGHRLAKLTALLFQRQLQRSQQLIFSYGLTGNKIVFKRMMMICWKMKYQCLTFQQVCYWACSFSHNAV